MFSACASRAEASSRLKTSAKVLSLRIVTFSRDDKEDEAKDDALKLSGSLASPLADPLQPNGIGAF
jgi:hypothetical protein